MLIWGEDIKYVNNHGDYKRLLDADLFKKIKNGDDNAFEELLSRYEKLINIKISDYKFSAIEKEDMFQEGVLGLLSAAKSYDPNNKASFKTYAGICIERRLHNLYKSINRKKDVPINSLVSFDEDISDDIGISKDKNDDDPERVVINKEENKSINHRIKESLSELELKVLSLYVNGSTYKEISDMLSISTKSVDNAIQRIRKKLR